MGIEDVKRSSTFFFVLWFYRVSWGEIIYKIDVNVMKMEMKE